jgi:hypothetical protein
VYIDQTVPSIDIASPEEDLVTSEPCIKVIGRVHDIGGITLYVQGEPIDIQGGAWRATVNLTDGWNVITVIARDVAGNSASRTFRVLLDRTPPSLLASFPLGPDILPGPSGGLVTGRCIANMSVGVSEGGILRVTGMDPVEVRIGDTTLGVDLAPGKNCFIVNFTDSAGNSAREVRIFIVRDVVPPEIHLTSPGNDTAVMQTWVDVAGATEAGASLTIDGHRVEVGADGAFRVRIGLAPGWNSINITATDRFGNSANATVRVERKEDGLGPSASGVKGGATVAVALLVAVLVVLIFLVSRTRGKERRAHRQFGDDVPSKGNGEAPGGVGVRVRRGR